MCSLAKNRGESKITQTGDVKKCVNRWLFVTIIRKNAGIVEKYAFFLVNVGQMYERVFYPKQNTQDEQGRARAH